MPTLSVFTPSHDPRFLDECLDTLAHQTFLGFEWIVVLNGGARWTPSYLPEWCRVYVCDELRGVGAAKSYACARAEGEYLVELDHDDLLTAAALELIVDEFESRPSLGFVYSDGAQITEDGGYEGSEWAVANGWHYHDETVDGRKVRVVDSLEPTPHNVSYIWFAPNHVRAFRRDIYEQVGGYDPDRDILDDQDLMCRLYQATEFGHIRKPLYFQRVHDGNTQRVQALNDLIQTETVMLYDRHVEANALAWAHRKGLLALDLGGAAGSPPGYISIDKRPSPNGGYVGDVFECLDRIEEGYGSGCVGVFRAADFMEHVPDKVSLANRLYDLLAPDGLLLSSTPSTDGRGAWQDPTHVAGYNENSFWYLTDASYAAYVPELTCRFQTSRLVTYFPTDFHRDFNIPYVQANLIAIKDGGARNGGALLWNERYP
jgi:O-antigen biosynthesis protein